MFKILVITTVITSNGAGVAHSIIEFENIPDALQAASLINEASESIFGTTTIPILLF
jgi:hypothetical protein